MLRARARRRGQPVGQRLPAARRPPRIRTRGPAGRGPGHQPSLAVREPDLDQRVGSARRLQAGARLHPHPAGPARFEHRPAGRLRPPQPVGHPLRLRRAAGGRGLPQSACRRGRAAALDGRDRSLVDTEFVAWYTFGVTHAPRPEDWPVMPVEYCGFQLCRWDSSIAIPALDVPPSARALPLRSAGGRQLVGHTHRGPGALDNSRAPDRGERSSASRARAVLQSAEADRGGHRKRSSRSEYHSSTRATAAAHRAPMTRC